SILDSLCHRLILLLKISQDEHAPTQIQLFIEMDLPATEDLLLNPIRMLRFLFSTTMGFKYTELSVTNNKEFEELVLNFNLSNLHSFIISMMLLFTSEEGTGNHFIGSAIKETYSWKDGEGKNKSPQKAQWHKLKRKVEYQACMWPVFVIPYNFPPWVCLQDLWLGVNTIDARAGKEFILHTLMGNQFLDTINARLDMEDMGIQKYFNYTKSQLFYASLRKYFLLHFLMPSAIWLDSIYSEGIGLHTKKIYMKRWFGIVCLRIHNFASFNEGNQDNEKTIEKQFATCVRKIEGHRIVEHQISHLWNTKHFCNMLVIIMKKEQSITAKMMIVINDGV
ncbi:hypothetical protein ACJX0J_030883, partial [Zea mays]